MSRKSKIRWRKSDKQELARVVKNFNAKIHRLRKKEGMADFLPDTVSLKSTMEGIETRADFNRVINSLKRFSKRGAEKPITSSRGARATKWEVDEFNLAQRVDNARKTRERKEILSSPVTIANEPTGVTRAEMGSIKENELKPSKHDFNSKSQREWDLARKALERRLKDNYTTKMRRYMQANYIRGLMNAGYSEELIKYMTTIPTDKFFQIVGTDEVGTFEFIYDPLELKTKEDKLWDLWEEHGTGKNELGLTMEEIEAFSWHMEAVGGNGSFRTEFFKYFKDRGV